jgi:hypothetical protein
MLPADPLGGVAAHFRLKIENQNEHDRKLQTSMAEDEAQLLA